MDGKAILDAVIALVIFIIFAIIYFIILAFIIKFGVGLVVDGDPGGDSIAIAAAVLTAGTIIAGGGIKDKFKLQ